MSSRARSRRSRSSAANLEVETSVAETPLLIPPRESAPTIQAGFMVELVPGIFGGRWGDAAREVEDAFAL